MNDTLLAARRLTEAGMPEAQAEATVGVVVDMIRQDHADLVRRADLEAATALLRSDTKAADAALQQAIEAATALLRSETKAADAALQRAIEAATALLRSEIKAGDSALGAEIRALRVDIGWIRALLLVILAGLGTLVFKAWA